MQWYSSTRWVVSEKCQKEKRRIYRNMHQGSNLHGRAHQEPDHLQHGQLLSPPWYPSSLHGRATWWIGTHATTQIVLAYASRPPHPRIPSWKLWRPSLCISLLREGQPATVEQVRDLRSRLSRYTDVLIRLVPVQWRFKRCWKLEVLQVHEIHDGFCRRPSSASSKKLGSSSHDQLHIENLVQPRRVEWSTAKL